MTQEEVERVRSVADIDWESLRRTVLESIIDDRASTKNNVHSRTKTHVDNVFAKMDSLGSKLPPFMSATDSVERKEDWKALLNVIAADFVRILETRLCKEDDSCLETVIANTLDSDWRPEDKAHKETIYYICGYLLRRLKKAADEDKNKHLKHALEQLVTNATVTREQARESNLPSGKVERIEIVELLYASDDMYKAILPIESVFHHLLNERSVYQYGTMMIADIIHYLVKADLGFDQFLPSEDDDIVSEVTGIMIDSYGNLQGKD